MPAEPATQVEGEPRPTRVVAAIIQHGDEVLIGQRRPDDKTAPLKWEFIGGKFDEQIDSTLEAALAREFWEEMRMRIVVHEEYARNSHTYVLADGTEREIELICFRCTAESYEYELRQVHAARWVRIGDLRPEEFAAADVPIVEKLMAE